MDAKSFHAGDLVITKWGERARVHTEPKAADVNIVLYFLDRGGIAPRIEIVNPARFTLIKPAPAGARNNLCRRCGKPLYASSDSSNTVPYVCICPPENYTMTTNTTGPAERQEKE